MIQYSIPVLLPRSTAVDFNLLADELQKHLMSIAMPILDPRLEERGEHIDVVTWFIYSSSAYRVP